MTMLNFQHCLFYCLVFVKNQKKYSLNSYTNINHKKNKKLKKIKQKKAKMLIETEVAFVFFASLALNNLITLYNYSLKYFLGNLNI